MDPLATAASLFFVIVWPAVVVVNTRFVIGSIRYPEMPEEMRPSSTRFLRLRKLRQTIPTADKHDGTIWGMRVYMWSRRFWHSARLER